jgi:hypothetical protein
MIIMKMMSSCVHENGFGGYLQPKVALASWADPFLIPFLT